MYSRLLGHVQLSSVHHRIPLPSPSVRQGRAETVYSAGVGGMARSCSVVTLLFFVLSFYLAGMVSWDPVAHRPYTASGITGNWDPAEWYLGDPVTHHPRLLNEIDLRTIWLGLKPFAIIGAGKSYSSVNVRSCQHIPSRLSVVCVPMRRSVL